MKYQYKLTEDDKYRAHKHARMLFSGPNYFNPGTPNGEDNFEYKYFGFLGEIAVSKMFNKPWNNLIYEGEAQGNKHLQKADVGEDIEVRTVTNPKFRLFLNLHEVPERRHISVLLDPDKYIVTLRGWVWNYEVMKEKYLHNGKYNLPAYWVPNWKLRNFK